MRRVPILAAILLLLVQIAATQQKAQLPPVSWTCPMHPDIVQAQKGKCSICKMELVPVRLETIWSCPVHSVVEETQQGKCPICRRDLVQVISALSWTCPNRPKIDQVNPAKCPDGSPMVPKHTPRAHGNHNPLHGGIFFMAPDNWHHLEGTYPEERLFRLHLYDDYTKPLPIDQVKKIAGRLIVNETQSYPLKPAANSAYLEAKIDQVPLPAELTAMVKFTREGPEHRFDFIFQEFSVDRAATVFSADVSGLIAIEIPDSTPEVLTLLNARSRQIRELIQKGAFGEIYVPAFQAKDLALALDVRAKELPARQRPAVTATIEQLVRSAWQLDADGDTGNRDQINEAYTAFSRAVEEVNSAFSASTRKR